MKVEDRKLQEYLDKLNIGTLPDELLYLIKGGWNAHHNYVVGADSE